MPKPVQNERIYAVAYEDDDGTHFAASECEYAIGAEGGQSYHTYFERDIAQVDADGFPPDAKARVVEVRLEIVGEFAHKPHTNTHLYRKNRRAAGLGVPGLCD